MKPIIVTLAGCEEMRGWDVESAWPTSEHLRELDLMDVYEPMVEGAAEAKARQSEL